MYSIKIVLFHDCKIFLHNSVNLFYSCADSGKDFLDEVLYATEILCPDVLVSGHRSAIPLCGKGKDQDSIRVCCLKYRDLRQNRNLLANSNDLKYTCHASCLCICITGQSREENGLLFGGAGCQDVGRMVDGGEMAR